MQKMRFVNVIALLIMLATNTLASVGNLIGGQSTGAVSDNNPSLFTPAGYVFSIWGIIYIGLIALVVFQLGNRRAAESVRQRLGPWFAINAILNAVWLFLWGYELLWLSVVVMLGLLATLIIMYERLRIGRPSSASEDGGPGATWAVRIPISIYTGWISVATIANITAALVNSGWQGGALGPHFWTVVVLLTGTALGLLAAILRRDSAYALVVVWAFVGIAVARPQETLIVAVALIGALAVLVASVFNLPVLRRKRG